MRLGIHALVMLFTVSVAACGGDDAPGGGAASTCNDGLRLSIEVDGVGGSAVRIALVGDGDMRTLQPYDGRGRYFLSSLWAPDGRTAALSGLDESAVVDTACEPFETSTVAGSAVSFSPDGQQLLVAATDEVNGPAVLTVSVIDVDVSAPIEPAPLASFDLAAAGNHSYSFEAAWSADSNHVAIAVVTDQEIEDNLPGHLYLVRPDDIGGGAVELGEVAGGETFAWSPDGRVIAFADFNGGVGFVEVSAIEEVYRIDEDLVSCEFGGLLGAELLWAPNSGAFLYAARPPASDVCVVREVRLDSEEARVVTRDLPDSSAALTPAWFQDSRHVVHLSADGRTLLWNDPEELASSPIAAADGDASIFTFAFSPAGDRLAALRGAASGSAELLVAATPGTPPELATVVGAVANPIRFDSIQWAPSGDRLVVAGLPGIHVLLPDEVTEVDARQARWSPDAGYLALLQDGDVMVYTAAGDAELADGQLAGQGAFALAWAPLPP